MISGIEKNEAGNGNRVCVCVEVVVLNRVVGKCLTEKVTFEPKYEGVNHVVI